MALARGLDFTLPPSDIKKGGYLANFEILFNKLDDDLFFGSNDDKLYLQNKLRDIAFSSMYNFNNARKNLLNIPKEELEALKLLSKNKSIVILKPDKGSGVVILNTSDYIHKVEEIVLDQTKFKKHSNQDLYKISRTVERKVRNYLRDKVKKPGFIDDITYCRLYPNGSRIGILYGLPKVHKQGCLMKPICSAIGTSTYQLSKFIANIIKPAPTNKFNTDLKDSFQFLNHLEGFNLNHYFMVSYDVRSLFTNVPLKETIKITMDRLYRSDHIVPPTMPENVLQHLLELCVQDNVFVFNGEVYYQHDGVAMGNSLGPILADIFMCHLEKTSILTSDLSPEFYRRYVDNTFCLFSNKEDAIKFLDYINTIHPSIKFDMELENNNKLEFLH